MQSIRNHSQPQHIILAGYPPLMKECFKLLEACGAKNYALFGGAVRDADYAARHNQVRAIKDYDIRVWLPDLDYEIRVREFVEKLGKAARSSVKEVPSINSNLVRYCLYLDGVELDISIRRAPAGEIALEAAAINRARDCDIGLSAVAIDPLCRAWAMPEYLSDHLNKTLTVYPGADIERKMAYAKRMQEKFPEHKIVWHSEIGLNNNEILSPSLSGRKNQP